ncbi:MAG: hypothetical protein ABN483_15765, partial [Pantoea agglomerans]
DIAVNNFHGARHDILCQPGIKVIGSHPLLLKKRGRNRIRMQSTQNIVQLHRARPSFAEFAASITL